MEFPCSSFIRIILGMKTIAVSIDDSDDRELAFITPPQLDVLRKAEVASASDIMRQGRLRLLGTLVRHDPTSWTTRASRIIANATHRGTSSKSWARQVMEDLEHLALDAATASNPNKWEDAIRPTVHRISGELIATETFNGRIQRLLHE